MAQDQESGAPPDPSTLFPITAYAQGGQEFGATEAARTQRVFSGFAVVQGSG